jgi:hypothetical protein
MWIFFIFRSSKIHVSPTGIVSSLFRPRCHLSSGWWCHTSFSLSQDEFVVSVLSFGNILSRRLPSQVKIEALNPHHHHRLLFLDRLTPTLHCYKKIFLILVTLSTTQAHLHFVSSLARAPRHRSSTHRHHYLSPLSHAHRSSTHWQLRWWTSWPSFASWTAYQHENSCKKIFWNATTSRMVIN